MFNLGFHATTRPAPGSAGTQALAVGNEMSVETDVAKTTRKSRWWHTIGKVILILVALVAAINFLADLHGPPLRVTQAPATLLAPAVVMIVNEGQKKIDIKQITVNDRPDCQVRLGIEQKTIVDPIGLSVGDQLLFSTNCNVVRVHIDTDDGSGTYTF